MPRARCYARGALCDYARRAQHDIRARAICFDIDLPLPIIIDDAFFFSPERLLSAYTAEPRHFDAGLLRRHYAAITPFAMPFSSPPFPPLLISAYAFLHAIAIFDSALSLLRASVCRRCRLRLRRAAAHAASRH
jgi:hypothetical protein